MIRVGSIPEKTGERDGDEEEQSQFHPRKRAGEGVRLIRVGSIPEKAQEGEKEE